MQRRERTFKQALVISMNGESDEEHDSLNKQDVLINMQ